MVWVCGFILAITIPTREVSDVLALVAHCDYFSFRFKCLLSAQPRGHINNIFVREQNREKHKVVVCAVDTKKLLGIN